MSPENYRTGLKAFKKPLLVLVGDKGEAFVTTAFEPAIKDIGNGEVNILKGVTHNGVRTDAEALKKIKTWSQKHFRNG